MSESRRIREQFIQRGAESLSDVELVSLILGDDTFESSSAETAASLMELGGNTLTGLAETEFSRLRMVRGVGAKKAATLSAALEMGKRLRRAVTSAPQTIATDADVTRIFRPMLADLDHEQVWALYLSNSNRILDKAMVSRGGVNATVADIRLIVKRGIELLCGGIILVHNHPSGPPEPSIEDKELTQKLMQAAALFDIRLLDHVIISAQGNFSFRAKGLL